MIDALRDIDFTLFYFINHDLANSFFDRVLPHIRGNVFLAICYVLFVLRVYQVHPEQFFKVVLFGALTFLLTDQLSSAVIKDIFQRVRPCNNPMMGARLLLAHCGSGYSFISSHAANSFGMAAFITIISPHKFVTAFVLGTWASLVCLAQVYVGVHYPADVFGGAVVGTLTGFIIGFITIKLLAYDSQNQF